LFGLTGLTLNPDTEDPSVAASSLSFQKLNIDPPQDEDDDAESGKLSLPAPKPAFGEAGLGLSYAISPQVLRLLQNLDSRLQHLEKENVRLKERAAKAKSVAVQALRAAVSASTEMKSTTTFLKKAMARVKDEVQEDLLESQRCAQLEVDFG
jgi:hypothetical protein